MKWNKVTDVLPPEGRDLLVWTGTYMFVSDAFYFTDEHRENAPEDVTAYMAKSKGHFQEFGHKSYFDDRKVYWAELPKPPPDDIICGAV